MSEPVTRQGVTALNVQEDAPTAEQKIRKWALELAIEHWKGVGTERHVLDTASTFELFIAEAEIGE